MQKATEDQPRGLVWGFTTRLEDCDFADDIVLPSHTQKDIQAKTDKMDHRARSVGLRILYPKKTKVTKVKNMDAKKSNAQGTELEEIKDFKYLGSYSTSQPTAT